MKRKFFELMMMLVKKCRMTEEKIRNEFGLTMAEYNALLSINEEEKVLCHVFSAKMGLSASRGSRVIDRLTKKGFVKGEAVPDDRRILKISMTTKGARLKNLIRARMDECENNILDGLSSEQREAVHSTLEVLCEMM